MRRPLAALVLAVSVSAALAFQNEPDGFRGLKWGDAPPADVKPTTADESLNFRLYARAGEKMSIGEAQLSALRYAFYKERFFSALLQTQGPENGRALLRALEAQFGEGSRPNRYMEDRMWGGGTGMISFTCRSGMQSCNAVIGSTALYRERRNDQKDAAAKAKGDF